MRDRNLRETLTSDIAYCGTDNNAGILKSLTPDCVVLSPFLFGILRSGLISVNYRTYFEDTTETDKLPRHKDKAVVISAKPCAVKSRTHGLTAGGVLRGSSLCSC